MITENIVLVAGVHGFSGHATAECWTRVPGTQVLGCRGAPHLWRRALRALVPICTGLFSCQV